MNLSTAIRRAAPPRAGLCFQSGPLARFVARCPLSCLIAAAALALHAVAALGVGLDGLVLSREAIGAGRLWTIFTGPLLHLSGQHLLFDVAGLLVVGYVFEPLLRRAYGVAVAVISIAVGVTFLLAYPHLPAYYGLSSLDQGLFAAGLVALWRRGDRRIAGTLLVMLALKWAFELSGATSLMSAVAADPTAFGMPVPLTHVAGGVAGLIVGLLSGGPARGFDRVEDH